MSNPRIEIEQGMPPWDVVFEVSEIIEDDAWVLVGGLMVQVHAMLNGRASRATQDVDVLIDLMVPGASAKRIVGALENAGFEKQEPGLRGSAFHRLIKDSRVIDVLIADHLPSGKRASAKVNQWPMMETEGGAQAIDRRMPVDVRYGDHAFRIMIPNLLGAIVMKSAAYVADRRSRERHLDDIALLCSFVPDVKVMRGQFKGSDTKRICRAWEALSDSRSSSWLLLEDEERKKGYDALRILASKM